MYKNASWIKKSITKKRNISNNVQVLIQIQIEI